MFRHCWIIVIGNVWKRYGQKLRRIILLPFGLVTFRFGYWRDRKPIIFMISGFLDVSLSPKTNMIYRWGHQDTSINPRKIPNHLKNNNNSENIKKLEIQHFENVGKDVCRTILKIRLICFGNLEDGIKIFQKT